MATSESEAREFLIELWDAILTEVIGLGEDRMNCDVDQFLANVVRRAGGEEEDLQDPEVWQITRDTVLIILQVMARELGRCARASRN
jgi:hypothetical protein